MNLGRIKFRLGRLQGYGTIPTSIIGLFASCKILGINYWWLLATLPIIYILHYVDKKWIHPQESATMFQDNPEWNRLAEKIDVVAVSLIETRNYLIETRDWILKAKTNELRTNNVGEAPDSLATRIEQQVQIDEAERILRSSDLYAPKSVGHRLAKLYRGELGDSRQHDGRPELRTQRTTGAI